MNTLRNRDVRLLVGSVGISAFGDFLGLVPLALFVQHRTGSGLAVAAFFFALFGPIAALGGVAGVLVDRYENTRLLKLVSAAQAVVAVALAFVGPLALLLPLVALLGVGAAIAAPAEFSLIPVAAGEEHVAKANGQVETARYLGMTVGPLVGGLMAGAGLGRQALLLDAVTFLIIATAATQLKTRRHPNPTTTQRKPKPTDGLKHIWSDRTLALTLSTAVATLAFFSISMTAELFFAKDTLGGGDAGYGVLLTGWTLGMVLGASTLAPRVNQTALAATALAAITVQGAGLAGAALTNAIALATAGFMLGGLAHGVKNVVIRTLMHHRVPDELRGRTFATYNAARNTAELGALIAGGLLVGAIGARTALLISGAVPLVIGTIAYIAMSRSQPTTTTIRRALHARSEG